LNFLFLNKTVTLTALTVFCFSGCSALNSRPYKQMAYAESALQAAMLAGSETSPEAGPVFQLAKDQLARARAFYRLKNFKEARLFAVKARRLGEEAEWRSIHANSDSKEAKPLGK
jgi:hypothetical protein